MDKTNKTNKTNKINKINKIGVFGGTFNPVHKGHEISAIGFYDKFALGKLLIIPANIPPHKPNYDGASARDRLEMCRICFDKYNKSGYNIEVSDAEIKKDGVSYTIDTIGALREIYPADSSVIYFLVGSDMFLYLEQWREYKKLLEMCVFAVAFRKTSAADAGEVQKLRERLINRGYKIELLENSALEISSTELREKLKRGAGAGYLREYLSPEVLNYIKERNIYVLQ